MDQKSYLNSIYFLEWDYGELWTKIVKYRIIGKEHKALLQKILRSTTIFLQNTNSKQGFY